MLRRRSGGFREVLSAVSITATDDFTASGSDDTRTGLSIGAEPASPKRRYVVVFATPGQGMSGGIDVTTVTMFGETGIELAKVNGGNGCYSGLWYAEVPTGTTGSVTLNYNTGNTAKWGLSIGTFTSGSFGVTETTATDTDGTDAAGLIQLSATAKKGGLLLCATSTRNGSTNTWTGPTELFDRDVDINDYGSGAYKQITADGTENVDIQNADTTPSDMSAAIATLY